MILSSPAMSVAWKLATCSWKRYQLTVATNAWRYYHGVVCMQRDQSLLDKGLTVLEVYAKCVRLKSEACCTRTHPQLID